MTTISKAIDERVEQALHEQFLDLVCSDEEMLRAEFAAIVAAEWPNPPDGTPGDRPAGEPPTPRGRPWWPAPGARRRNRPRRPGLGERSRQRSPPADPDPRRTPTREETGPSRTQ